MKKGKTRFNRIVIIGVGLIGGSIGLAIKKRGLAKVVVGLCRRRSSASKALKAGAVDIATLNYDTALKGADLVIIATAVGKITDIAKVVQQKATGKILLTDAGSTKEQIVSTIDNMVKKDPNISFVGSHPMAGSEKTGVLAASIDLFNDSVCVLTPTKHTDVKALTKIKGFWKELGCICKVIDPAKHDKFVCQVSHIPHILSSMIASNADDKALEYQGTGYKNMTRLALGDPILWRDIIFSNAKNICKELEKQKKAYDNIIKVIKQGKDKQLVEILEKARSKS